MYLSEAVFRLLSLLPSVARRNRREVRLVSSAPFEVNFDKVLDAEFSDWGLGDTSLFNCFDNRLPLALLACCPVLGLIPPFSSGVVQKLPTMPRQLSPPLTGSLLGPYYVPEIEGFSHLGQTDCCDQPIVHI